VDNVTDVQEQLSEEEDLEADENGELFGASMQPELLLRTELESKLLVAQAGNETKRGSSAEQKHKYSEEEKAAEAALLVAFPTRAAEMKKESRWQVVKHKKKKRKKRNKSCR